MLKSICLFLESGNTFTFRDVTITTDNETVIAFKYTAMSDSGKKSMLVYKSQIIGYSVTEYETKLEGCKSSGVIPPASFLKKLSDD